MRYILTTLLIGILQVLAAQQARIEGRIVDAERGSALENVTVTIEPGSTSTLTNENGFFRFQNLEQGNYTLRCSRAGYETIQRRVAAGDTSLTLRIQMVSSSKTLTDVTVTGMTDEAAEALAVKQNVMPVSILTSKQIENRASNLNELLARQAGVQIRRSGGFGSEARISIRGLEGKRVQIFIDGKPLNTPDGSLGINDLPLQIIERIEIYKGAVPAWLGGDGLGSAVNVVMRHRDVSYIDATAGYQSYNTLSTGLILKKTWDKKGTEFGAGIFTNSSDNDYMMQLPAQSGIKVKRDHDRFQSVLGGAALRLHHLWFDEIEVEGAYLQIKKELQGIQRNIQHIESTGESAFASLSLDKKSFFTDKLAFRYNTILANINVKFIDTSSYNYGWDGRKIPSLFGKGELGIGPNRATTVQKEWRQHLNLNYAANRIFNINLNSTSRYTTYNPNDTVGNKHAGKNLFNYPGNLLNVITGITLESRIKEDRLLFSTALKHYYNQTEGYNTNFFLQAPPEQVNTTKNLIGYNAGVRYNFTKALMAKASHERAVRLPNNAELFGDGILITPAIFLKPEIGLNNSLGLFYDQTNQKGKRLQAEANGFYMLVDNLIQLSGNGLSLGYVNFSKARIIGGDAEVKYDVTKNLYASFNVTYQKVIDANKTIPGTEGVPNPTYKLEIPNIPQLFGNWSVEYSKDHLLGKGSRTKLLYEGSYTQQYHYGFNVSVYDEYFIPSFLTHTFSIEQSFKDKRYILSAEANNITDEVVINNYNQPLPGRTFRIKVRYLLLGKKLTQAHHSHH